MSSTLEDDLRHQLVIAAARGIADPEKADTTWHIGAGAPVGPFQIYDVVGLTTSFDQGKLCVATGGLPVLDRE
jgi:3-hydroxyacyl-CoA dehydrogenase